ncbi:MAG: hypothetical protein R3F34_17230 [Planctomycetota bacterium]
MTSKGLDLTPRLAALLRDLRARLVRATLVDATGRLLLVVGAWVGLSFLLDWSLDLPRAVRVVLFVGLLATISVTVLRRLVRGLRGVPDDAALAVVAERGAEHGEDLLVSAVQFQSDGGGTSELERDMRGSVLRRAEALAASVDVRALVDARGPARRFGSGFLVAAAAAVPLLVSPLADEFLARFLGGATPWPQRTYLSLEVVSGAVVEQDGEDFVLTVPRGGDVALAVHAEGEVPRTVEIRGEDALPQVLLPDRNGVFRAVLRSVTASDRFVVRGGDDRDGSPSARIVVVDPPDLASLVLEVVPPPYTGLETRRVVNTGTTALRGSVVRIYAATRPTDAGAVLQLLPTDRSLEPERVAPPDDLVATLGDAPVLFHELVLDESLRLRFELTDDRGLSSPDPGLFALDVVEDRAPEIVRLVPTRSDVETSAVGVVRAVLTLRDDFGLSRVAYVVRNGTDGPVVRQGELEPSPISDAVSTEWSATVRLDVADCLASGEGEGSQLAIEFLAYDTAEPPQEGRDTSLRVRVLGGDELLRRVKDRLAKARVQASRLSERVLDSRRRIEELADIVDAAGVSTGEEASGLRTMLASARRTQSDGQALLRELTGVCELVLYARLDDKAGGLLEALDREFAGQRSRSFEAEPWRKLVAAQARSPLATEGFGSHLVSIAALGLDLVDGPLERSASALDAATSAQDANELLEGLIAASSAHTEALELVEKLLERLSEWDNYQSVLTLTRDLLERQKALSERTKRFASDR